MYKTALYTAQLIQPYVASAIKTIFTIVVKTLASPVVWLHQTVCYVTKIIVINVTSV